MAAPLKRARLARTARSVAEFSSIRYREGQKLKGHGNLTSIQGIGSLGASIRLSVFGDVRDFPEEGKLVAYFGIVPRIHNSNQTERSGHMTKRGSKLGRTALVECSLIAKRFSARLDSYYEHIRIRRGTGRFPEFRAEGNCRMNQTSETSE